MKNVKQTKKLKKIIMKKKKIKNKILAKKKVHLNYLLLIIVEDKEV